MCHWLSVQVVTDKDCYTESWKDLCFVYQQNFGKIVHFDRMIICLSARRYKVKGCKITSHNQLVWVG